MPLANSDKIYAEHLASVNDSTKVMLSQDLHNQSGVLIAKKGVLVTKRVAEVIAKHKLVRPLENAISLDPDSEKVLSTDSFEQYLVHLNLVELLEINGLHEEALSNFSRLQNYPMVIQKLSILSLRLDEEFERVVFCAVFSMVLATELQLSKVDVFYVFLGALLSNVGLLHLPPALVRKKEEYSGEEWKTMQGHIVIAKHFVDVLPNLPQKVGRMILEHHERPDGFGYPFGKTEKKLCLEGQIIAMSDKVNGLYKKWVVNGQRSWQSLSAIVQISTSSNTPTIRDATLRVLKRMHQPISSNDSANDMAKSVNSLQQQHIKLNKWFKVISDILALHHKELYEEGNFKPYGLLTQLNQIIISSGLLSEVQLIWLKELTHPLSQHDWAEVDEYKLKLGEIEYQCLFVMQKLFSQHDELTKRFNSEELATHYYQELMGILQS